MAAPWEASIQIQIVLVWLLIEQIMKNANKNICRFLHCLHLQFGSLVPATLIIIDNFCIALFSGVPKLTALYILQLCLRGAIIILQFVMIWLLLQFCSYRRRTTPATWCGWAWHRPACWSQSRAGPTAPSPAPCPGQPSWRSPSISVASPCSPK